LWVLQAPEFIHGVFGKMPLDGCIMAKADPHELDSASIARRLRILRQHSQGGGQGSQARFAAQIGVEYRRWNNYERGHP
jgi:hypothetical protein